MAIARISVVFMLIPPKVLLAQRYSSIEKLEKQGKKARIIYDPGGREDIAYFIFSVTVLVLTELPYLSLTIQ